MVSSIVGRCPYPTPCGKYRRCAERWRRVIWLQALSPPCLPRCDQANWQPRGWRERCAGRGQAEQTSCSYGRGECRCECAAVLRSAEHTSDLPSLMRISYAVFCLHKTPSDRTEVNTT